MTDPYALTQEEMQEYVPIVKAWVIARDKKDYEAADKLRGELLEAGVLLRSISADGLDFAVGAVSESSAHRLARVMKRRAKGER